MSNLNHRPILHVNGSGYQNLYEQYFAAFKALEEAEQHARALLRSIDEAERLASRAFPHARDYYISQDPYLADKAREEYRVEVSVKIANAKPSFDQVHNLAKIIDAKNYVHDLLQDVIRQNEDRDFRRARYPSPTEPVAPDAIASHAPTLVAPAKILD